MDCLSVMRRKDALIHATAWMDLRTNTLRTRSQTQKATYCRFHLYKVSGTGKYLQTESKLVLATGRGWE